MTGHDAAQAVATAREALTEVLVDTPVPLEDVVDLVQEAHPELTGAIVRAALMGSVSRGTAIFTTDGLVAEAEAAAP